MKTFKKIAVMIIAAAMVFGMFTALGTAQTKADEGIVAGLICLHDENSTYDLNFINAFKEACEARGLVEGETYYISTNIPEGQERYEETMNMVDRGCNVAVRVGSTGNSGIAILGSQGDKAKKCKHRFS